MNKVRVIAIDGPSGSGKSTIAKRLASDLELTYLDTGALYRSLAYKLDQMNIDAEDLSGIEVALNGFKLEYGKSDGELVVINGENLTTKIREHIVSELASKYSKLVLVRDFLQGFQREFAVRNASVLEGRDIGTVIFPNAALKIFLTADARVRAYRRLAQLQEMGQQDVNLETILADIEKRDAADKNRSIAPLVKASDAFEIDTSELDVEQIISKMKRLYSENSFFFPT